MLIWLPEREKQWKFLLFWQRIKKKIWHFFGRELGVLQANPKFLLLFERTSLWELSATNNVPKLHIHLSSSFFKSFSCSLLSSRTTGSAAMASSESPWWHSPKCLVSPQAVQFSLLISPLCLDHLDFMFLVEPTMVIFWNSFLSENYKNTYALKN